MGYTHHWYRKPVLDADKFKAAIADCKKACAASHVTMAAEFGDSTVRIDGGCETFTVEQASIGRFRDGRVFEFCKTEKMPYDLCVTACLIVFKHHFGDDFIVTSDGEDKGFAGARTLCQKALGYGSGFKVDPRQKVDDEYDLPSTFPAAE